MKEPILPFFRPLERLKKFQISVTMGIRIFVIVIGRVVECR